MKKILNIGWKDLKVIFRDRAALILMLAAPLAMTIAMGLITGSFSGSQSSGLARFPMVVVNQDAGPLGGMLADVLSSKELADLVQATVEPNAAAARQQVDKDKVAAAVIVPPGFSAGLVPADPSGKTGPAVPVEVYVNPARPISAGVVQAIVEEFTNRVETTRVAANVATAQMLARGLISPDQIGSLAERLGEHMRLQTDEAGLIGVRRNNQPTAQQALEFNPLAVLAPAMALLFLMYAVSLGGRGILTERQEGTLARLLTTPTPSGQVLVGKVIGVYLTGVAQMGILIVASALLFRLRWGDPLAVLLLVLAAAAGAAGWGLLLAAIAKTPGQVSGVGMAMTLLFGLLGGSFFGGQRPGALQVTGMITPNAWGMDGFTALARGGTLADILPIIGALLLMGIILTGTSIVLFNRRGLLQD